MGGMAEILLARVRGPSGFERPVVLKRILPHLSATAEFRNMFLDEARIVANIRHRNVVAVHELGEEGDELFLVMEYLEGESLSSVLRELKRTGQPLPLRVALHVVVEACAGLHAAHELTGPDGSPLEIVHRDVTPHNLFVQYDGQVKVIDFGIAKGNTSSIVTQTGQLKGKFAYMAPEQCKAEKLDRRADVFALGVVLFELTTGRRLFERDNDLLVFHAICEDDIPSPREFVGRYPKELETIVMSALSRGRDKRYASAAALRRDLLAVLRALTNHESPEEELAGIMSRVFADRVREKQATLRTIERGGVVAHVPAAEPGSSGGGQGKISGVEQRPALESGSGAGTPAAMVRRSGAVASPGTFASKRSAWMFFAGLAGAAALAAVALGATGVLRHAPATPPEGSAPPAPTSAVIDVTSNPMGAEVSVGGAVRGMTPMRLELPRGGDVIEVGLRKEGFVVATEQVVPDRDQRITVVLASIPAPAASAPAPPTEAATPLAPVSASSSAAAAPGAGWGPSRRPPPRPPPTGGGFTRFD